MKGKTIQEPSETDKPRFARGRTMLAATVCKQCPAGLAALETRYALADATAAIDAMRKLLDELNIEARVSTPTTTLEPVLPSADSLLESSMVALETLRARVKQHLWLVDTLCENEMSLFKMTAACRLEVSEVDEALVNATLTTVRVRTSLDEVSHDLALGRNLLAILSRPDDGGRNA
jgi:hypothetical protein